MTGRHVALLRGINVGRARRIAMADLRALLESLGFGEVRTLLNSGNVVFTAPAAARAEAAGPRIEKAMTARLGVSASVMVLTAAELAEAIVHNPLSRVAKDPSRLLVAVLREAADRRVLEPLARQDWKPEALALGKRVAYVWCAGGINESRAWAAVNRALGDGVTSRNWATLSKLQVLCDGPA
jgi:uncharacterized protein (DUF1697 family)